MRKSRTNYLSYIEETPKQLHKLQEVAKAAAKAAIRRAKGKRLAVTYVEDGWIVREEYDGRTIRLKKLNAIPIKVTAGERFLLP
jgi:hypothetical protein